LINKGDDIQNFLTVDFPGPIARKLIRY